MDEYRRIHGVSSKQPSCVTRCYQREVATFTCPPMSPWGVDYLTILVFICRRFLGCHELTSAI
jgi:hypothetical protein